MSTTPATSPPEIEWDWLRERMLATSWSEQARDAGVWALDVLEETLGPPWPKAWRGAGKPPPEIARCWFLFSAYLYTLDLALGFAVLRDRPGIAGLRSTIRRTSRDDALASPRLQLRLAGLALAKGYTVTLEPRLEDGKRPAADLLIADDRTRIGAEVFAQLRDEKTLAADKWIDGISDELRQIGDEHKVDFRGTVEAALSPRETTELLEELRSRASLVGRGVKLPPVTVGEVSVEVAPPEGPGGERSLQLPHVAFDRRLKNRLRKKADQTRRSRADWLVIDSLDDLWHMTGWARQPLTAKAYALASLFREALGEEEHLLGVVITDGAAVIRDQIEEDTFVLDRGIVARRRRIDRRRARESVVVPLRDGGLAAAEAWGFILDFERDWLAQALESQGVIPPPELGG
ncbi:MAG: hypothetical protein JSU06_16540 [Actinobacteria bacterium]|nr:hypothetical protein [Actinomycetota bacterium]